MLTGRTVANIQGCFVSPAFQFFAHRGVEWGILGCHLKVKTSLCNINLLLKTSTKLYGNFEPHVEVEISSSVAKTVVVS